MAQIKEPKIILALIIGFGLITGGMLLFRKSTLNHLAQYNLNFDNAASVAGDELTDRELADKISTGEKLILELEPNSFQETATQAFADGNYEKAASLWSSSLKQQRNDPETRIYLNNALIADKPSYSIAVPVPGNEEINVAKEILRGAAQAQQEINQSGGMNGRPIKLIVADDGNNPKTAKKLAANFSQDTEILGIVGHYSSNVTVEAAQIYQEEGLVAISPTSTSIALSDVGSYVFRTVSSDCFTGSALAEHLANSLKIKQTALLYNSASSYSTSLRDVFKNRLEAMNGEVVAEFNFSMSNFSIVNVLAEIEQKNAKALVLFPSSSQMNALETIDKTLLIAQVNKGKLPLFGADTLYKPRTLQVGQQYVENMVLVIPWRTDSANLEFSTAAEQLWGGKVNWRTISTYDATIALAQATKANPSREGIQQALLSPDFDADGASGKVKFLPTGDRAPQVELVKVVASDNSSFGYDFVPLADNNYTVADMCK